MPWSCHSWSSCVPRNTCQKSLVVSQSLIHSKWLSHGLEKEHVKYLFSFIIPGSHFLSVRKTCCVLKAIYSFYSLHHPLSFMSLFVLMSFSVQKVIKKQERQKSYERERENKMSGRRHRLKARDKERIQGIKKRAGNIRNEEKEK